jgi:hypothetical protein
MKRSELYVFCEAGELQAWLEVFLGEFKGVVADFTLWKPAQMVAASEAMLRLDKLNGSIVFYFGKVNITSSDSEFSIASGANSGIERLSISNQFNKHHKLPYWICAYMIDGSLVCRDISSLMRRIKKHTWTGMRLIEGKESFPWKMGRYSDGAVKLQGAGTKFFWSEGSNFKIKFGLDDQSGKSLKSKP